ncbi:MAG: hypothetical protein Q9187_000251 [Circinaria calcarea]
MRGAAYVGTSLVLATGVIVRALHERANFYSVCVYLAQSNACLMVLTNLVLLGIGAFMFGMQRLLYGTLRVIEIEQLYEKAWFAITETCLAMTIFREEVGGWFLVMFMSLLIGKVWGWIGEGRVDILEQQQPPANPRLFHIRLSISLILSALFDLHMLSYSVQTVREQAEPNMMVMFAFEFAVLAVTSLSTAARYCISLHEAAVIKEQTRLQLQERRARAQRQRENVQHVALQSDSVPSADPTRLNDDTAVEDEDVDVPGWEEKGRWVFYLDLVTDFFKLILYLSFFFVLCIFYGMPIHIIRDVALTIRSFYKRITDFLRYRHATRDMNERYPDATTEEVAREDVCIICRETMTPWRTVPLDGNGLAEGTMDGEGPRSNVDARLRPKKLPCGHILHFACLRSWLERQQNCPTCRRPVLASSPAVHSPVPQLLEIPARMPHANAANGGVQVQGPIQQPGARQNRIRIFNFGPFRIGFGAGQDLQGLAQQVNRLHPVHQAPLPGQIIGNDLQGVSSQQANQGVIASFSPNIIQAQLQQIEQQLVQQINSLQAQADQLFMVRALQGELVRLRILQADQGANTNPDTSDVPHNRFHMPPPNSTPIGPIVQSFGINQQVHTGLPETLPPGLTIPEGWTLLPLQRLPQNTPAFLNPHEPFNGAGRGRGTPGATSQVSDARSTTSGLPGPSQNGAASNAEGTSSANAFISSPVRESSSFGHEADSLGNHPKDHIIVGREGKVNNPASGQKHPTSTESSVAKPTIPQLGTVHRNIHETDNPAEGAISPPAVSHSENLGDGQSSSTAGDPKGKGKGRAVTIEDVAEDLD